MKLNQNNYHSVEANRMYLSSSQYKNFVGTVGKSGCEAGTLARIHGVWNEETSASLSIGSYVDAYFSNSLEQFKLENPDIFKKDGTLKSNYISADKMISRIEKDKKLMEYMGGEKQVIMTANFFGYDWKIMIDIFHENKAIVDLKTCENIQKSFWTKDCGRIDFIRYWGYDIQMAIYQKVVEIQTGKKLPCFIVAVSKEKEPNIELIGFSQLDLDSVLLEIENNSSRINQLKNNAIAPQRCGVCDYCKSIKIIEKPIHFSDLILNLG